MKNQSSKNGATGKKAAALECSPNPASEEIRARLERTWKTWASTTHTWIELAGVRIEPETSDFWVCRIMALVLQATRDWALHYLATESAEERRDPASSDYDSRTDNPLIPALREVVRIAEVALMLIMVPSQNARGVNLISPVSDEAEDRYADFAGAHRRALVIMRRQLDTAIGQNAHMLDVLKIDRTKRNEDEM